jgi:hypothetical protein
VTVAQRNHFARCLFEYHNYKLTITNQKNNRRYRGIGSFYQFSNKLESRYYPCIRAYATNSVGTTYGYILLFYHNSSYPSHCIIHNLNISYSTKYSVGGAEPYPAMEGLQLLHAEFALAVQPQTPQYQVQCGSGIGSSQVH